MFSNRLAFAVLGIACVTAAGAGSYLATRQNAGTTPLAAAPAPEATTPAGTTPEAPPAPAEAPSSQPTPARSALAAADPAPAASVSPEQEQRRERQLRNDDLRESRRTEPRRVRESAAAEPAPAPPTPVPSAAITEPLPLETTAVAPPPVSEPLPPSFDELVVAVDSVIGLQTESTITSDRARVEDRVEAKVVRDVRVGGQVAIPAGTRATGTVVEVQRGGKFKERALIGIRFDSLTLPDGLQLPLETDTIFRYGEAPGNGSAARIGGGAVAGAILGAILGGGKGAAIGASTGAGAGTAAVVAGERSTASFPAGAEVTARILAPVVVTVEHE
jgi:hypothetical protein